MGKIFTRETSSGLIIFALKCTEHVYLHFSLGLHKGSATRADKFVFILSTSENYASQMFNGVEFP